MTTEQHIARIRADIDNPELYLVFADWLQEQGDPWGQLITLQYELEQRPGDGAIAGQIDTLLKKNKWAPAAKPRDLRVDWRWGFIRGVRVYDEYDNADLDKVLGPILDLPMAALVQSCLIFRDARFADNAIDKVKDRVPPTTELKVITPLELPVQKEPADQSARWVSAQHTINTDIEQFKQLAFLACGGVSTLPRALATLPLERLDIDWCGGLQTIPDAVWGIESLGYISMYDCDGLGLNMGQVNNLLAGFLRARTPSKQRVLEAGLLQGTVAAATTEQLLSALDNNVKIVRQRALELLNGKLESPLHEHPIGTGSVVAVLGSLNIERKVLKARIEAVGAKLASKVTTKTTHVVLGEKPKGKQHDVRDLPVALASHLTQLMTATVQGVALPLAELACDLRSNNDAKIVAVVKRLQEHAAIPAELLPELFCILQDTALEKKGKGRKLTKKLFAAYAPAALRTSIATHMKTSILLAGETKKAVRLMALEAEAGTVIDMARLARLLTEDYGSGFKFITARGDDSELAWALERRINNKCLDVSGLELESLPDLSAYELTTVNASGNHLSAFPKQLGALPSLTTLDLRGNYMRTLPRSLKEFGSLEKLDLSLNNFQTFPKGVVTIANLKDLDLSADTWGEARITKIPKDIVKLAKLERLNVSNGHAAVAVPPEMAAMTWLKRFEVTWAGDGKRAPAALRKLLPNCEIS